MKTFSYRGFGLAGQSARGLIEALDVKEARERLARQGVLVERVEPAEGSAPRSWRGRARWQLDDRAVFYRELAALTKAGLPLVGAIEILMSSQDQQARASFLAALRDRLREGGTLAQSLQQVSGDITVFEQAILASGARAGNLDAVLEQLAGYLDDQVRLREGLQSALLYPVLVIALATLIGIAMMGFVMPSLGRVFAEGNIPLPFLTRALLWTGQHVMTVIVAPLLVLIGLAAVLARRFARNPGFRVSVEQWADRLPVLRRGGRLLASLRFARTLSLLLKGGVPLVEALEMSGRATGSRWIADDVRRGAEGVRHGKSLVPIMRSVPALGDHVPGWFQAGEASGDLSGMLDQAAVRFQQQWEQYLNRVLKLVEPLLILVVGFFVLAMALAILLPILSLNRAAL